MPEQVCSGIFYTRRFLKRSASWKFYIIAEATNPEAELRENITRNIKDGTELKRSEPHSPTSHYTTLPCSKLHTPRHHTALHYFAWHCTARHCTAWHHIAQLTLRDVALCDVTLPEITLPDILLPRIVDRKTTLFPFRLNFHQSAEMVFKINSMLACGLNKIRVDS